MAEDVIFYDSRLERDGEVYYTARLNGRDTILTLFDIDSGPGARSALKGIELATTLRGRPLGLKISPASYENMLAFDRQVAPERKLVALNKEAGLWYGLGTGNRVIITEKDGAILGSPTALGVFEGIFRAVVKHGVPNWFIQQSIVRELIPEGVDPEQHLGMGHTGGYGPRELLRSGLFAFASLGGYTRCPLPIGADADHAIVTGRSEGELAESLELNKIAIAESRDYTKFTVDTSRLFGFPVTLSAEERKRLLKAFHGRTFAIPNILDGRPGFRYAFDDEEIMRLGHKYWRACRVHKELYDFISGLKGDEPFDYELSLDETPAPSEPREVLFYLVVLEEVLGLPKGAVTSAAPNFGFRKRADYEGDIEHQLIPLVNECASILAAFGATVCFHSGSGKGIATGKGPGVDEALAEATGGRLQLKVSGIFQEILWRVLAGSPVPEERALFERAWDETKRVVEVLSAIYDRLIAGYAPEEAEALLSDEARLAEVGGEEAVRLVRQVLSYGLGQAKLAKRLLATANPANKDAADDFFRYFAYLVFRPLRAEIYSTMTEGTWQRYTEAVADYTEMRIKGLGL